MRASAGLRRALLTLHLAVSVGWVGAVVAYLALDVTATTAHDEANLRAAYVAMDLLARLALVPLALAALLTGLVVSATSRWGLFRHYWVVVSLVLTVAAVAVLLVETRVIARFAAVAADPTSSVETLRGLGGTLPHSVGGLAVLLLILVLNVYKPRGLTRYGLRKQREARSLGAQE